MPAYPADKYTFHLSCDAPKCPAQALRATQEHADAADGAEDAERVAKATKAAWKRGWRWVSGGEAWCPKHARGKATR
jgi:hypothetical protein